MAESELLLHLVRWHFDDGSVVEVECRPELAELIQRLDRAMEARERRHQKRVTAFSNLKVRVRRADGATGLDPDAIEATDTRRIGAHPTAAPWAGPRFAFTLLLGLSLPWPLPVTEEGPCLVCGGRPLPPHAYCLNCDASGRDRDVPGPEQRPKTTRPVTDNGLAGGTGPAQPRPKPAKRPAPRKKTKGRRRAATGGNSFDLAKLRGGLDGR